MHIHADRWKGHSCVRHQRVTGRRLWVGLLHARLYLRVLARACLQTRANPCKLVLERLAFLLERDNFRFETHDLRFKPPGERLEPPRELCIQIRDGLIELWCDR